MQKIRLEGNLFAVYLKLDVLIEFLNTKKMKSQGILGVVRENSHPGEYGCSELKHQRKSGRCAVRVSVAR